MEEKIAEETVSIKQPKTAKGKKLQRAKEGQLIEGPKKTIFIKGNKTCQSITNIMKDLYLLKKQNSILFSKKHDIHPFDDAEQIKKYAKNYDCSLFVFGSHSKKRPNNIVFGRLFDHEILDMVEIFMQYSKSTVEFSQKIDIPLFARPAIIFQGDVFEYNTQCIKLKNYFLDFFTENMQVKSLNLLTGFTHAIIFSGAEGLVKMRTYKISVIRDLATSDKLKDDESPIQLLEIGPSIDMVVKRENWASEDAMKKACKQPKAIKKPGQKNILHDKMGDKKGKLYVDQQNLQQISLRKRKSLKQNKKQKERIQKLENLENQ